MTTNVGSIVYTVTADTAGLLAAEKRAQQSLNRMGDAGDGLKTRMTAIAGAISAALGAIAVEGIVSKIVGAQRQFDVLFASLKTMTGGAQQAGVAWERLVKFAAQTPFTLEQSVKGFTKLKALGLDPSERAMTSFGNTASAMGKDLMQMIEAVADASTGEFERLKEFGIKSRDAGDKVKFTFQGVTTSVKKNADDITAYLVKLGEVQFAGAMSERMKTLDGDISNLQDALQQLYLTMSQSGAGDAIAKAVRTASEAIAQASASIKEGQLTDYFAALKPYITAAEVAVLSLAGTLTAKLVAGFVVSAAAAVNGTAAATAYAAAQAAAAAAAVAAAKAETALAQAEVSRAALSTSARSASLAASARLAAAVSAEAAATVAATAADRALTVARGGTVASTTAATVATVELTLAQRASAAATVASAAAGRLFTGVIAALGGPIGIAITGLVLLALNFDKLRGSATDAAEMTEQAGERIAAALRRSPAAASRDLVAMLAETKAEIADIDKELTRTGANKASDADLAAIRKRRDTLTTIAADITKAQDKIYGTVTATIEGGGGLRKPPPDVDPKIEAKRLEALGYYQALKAANAQALDQINLEEERALTDNKKRMAEDAANVGIYAKAKVEILKKYARERALLEEKGLQDAANLNIAITTDETTRIEAIRAEAFRAADAAVRLGTKTFAEAERAKVAAAFDAGQQLIDLADRNARADADYTLAQTRDAETRIRVTKEETIRALELAAARGKITQAELAAGRARAEQQSTTDTEALARQRGDVNVQTLQVRANGGGVESQVALIRAETEQRLRATVEAQQTDLGNLRAYEEQRIAITEDAERRIAEIRANANQAALMSTSDAFGAIATVLKNSGKEQSGAYKVMFAAQKAFSIASSIVAIQSGIAKAANAPFPENLAGMAAVAAATAGIISTIQGTNYGGGRQYGGPVSADSLYRVNETGRPEMFTGSNGQQFMLPTQGGRVTPADQVGAGGGVQIIVNNYTGSEVTATASPDGRMVEIAVRQAETKIAGDISAHQGPVWQAMRSSTNVTPRL